MNLSTVVADEATLQVLRNIDANPMLAIDLLKACKMAATYHNPHGIVGLQLKAAIVMVELGHIPRRPLAESLQREAAAIGQQLDPATLEQGEPA